MNRSELISLSGEVVNGILPSNGVVLAKIIDRALHKQIAEIAVNIAYDMLTKIDNIEFNQDNQK